MVLFKNFRVLSLGTKSYKADSRENLVVLDNTIYTNDIMTSFKRDVRGKEVVNLDEDILPSKNILEPINTRQPIF